ncbi:hypothetical protein [Flavonifractor plautii]|uniref:hypothetical protein n=1 Tax=Flavonifractor plautii TaxID=292800 RepID=UPI00195919DF|nr:hypothetical protein [Flavonifractor plautii]MBM6663883.1 hypothetical protein [Flavonifractor plautii]
MLNEIFDRVYQELGSIGNELTRGERLGVGKVWTPGQKPRADHPQPKAEKQQTKLSARRDRRGGEDPWDWKEEKPPWEF